MWARQSSKNNENEFDCDSILSNCLVILKHNFRTWRCKPKTALNEKKNVSFIKLRTVHPMLKFESSEFISTHLKWLWIDRFEHLLVNSFGDFDKSFPVFGWIMPVIRQIEHKLANEDNHVVDGLHELIRARITFAQVYAIESGVEGDLGNVLVS